MITATDGSVSLAALSDSGTPAELEINSDTSMTLTSIDIANLLDVNVDVDDDGSETLTSGTLSAGTVTIDGSSDNETFNFNSTVTSTTAGVTISSAAVVDLNAAVQAATTLDVNEGVLQFSGGTITNGGNADVQRRLRLGCGFDVDGQSWAGEHRVSSHCGHIRHCGGWRGRSGAGCHRWRSNVLRRRNGRRCCRFRYCCRDSTRHRIRDGRTVGNHGTEWQHDVPRFGGFDSDAG